VVVLPPRDYEALAETIEILKDRATMNSLLENRLGDEPGSSEVKTISEAFNDVMEGKDQ